MRDFGIFGVAAAIIGALSPIVCSPASAEVNSAAAAPASSQSSPTSDAAKVKELEERIDQRDAVIRDLLQRVARLEREQTAHASAEPGAANNAVAKTAENPTPTRQANGSSQAAAQGPSPTAPRQSQQASSEPAKPGPGGFDVSEADAQHALERALVQTGAALLPQGKIELVPSLTYQFQQFSHPGLIALTSTGSVLITENATRRTEVDANALVRVGLPWDAQLEVGLPWSYKGIDVATTANGAGLSGKAVDVQGVGDLTVSLTKQILVENDLRPGLFATVGWNSNLGEVKSHVPLGSGFDELSAGLIAVKRQDPLVFRAGFNYQYSIEHNGYKPAEQYIPSAGLILAISPETSLQFNQVISFSGRDTFHGKPIPGTEKAMGIFEVGVLSILGRGRVVNFTVGIGETTDAPNVFVQLAIPLRMN
jgi:hypothetical protein